MAIPHGRLFALSPASSSVTSPAGVIRPILPLASVNHRFPSGPAAIDSGKLSSLSPSV